MNNKLYILEVNFKLSHEEGLYFFIKNKSFDDLLDEFKKMEIPKKIKKEADLIPLGINCLMTSGPNQVVRSPNKLLTYSFYRGSFEDTSIALIVVEEK